MLYCNILSIILKKFCFVKINDYFMTIIFVVVNHSENSVCHWVFSNCQMVFSVIESTSKLKLYSHISFKLNSFVRFRLLIITIVIKSIPNSTTDFNFGNIIGIVDTIACHNYMVIWKKYIKIVSKIAIEKMQFDRSV